MLGLPRSFATDRRAEPPSPRQLALVARALPRVMRRHGRWRALRLAASEVGFDPRHRTDTTIELGAAGDAPVHEACSPLVFAELFRRVPATEAAGGFPRLRRRQGPAPPARRRARRRPGPGRRALRRAVRRRPAQPRDLRRPPPGRGDRARVRRRRRTPRCRPTSPWRSCSIPSSPTSSAASSNASSTRWRRRRGRCACCTCIRASPTSSATPASTPSTTRAPIGIVLRRRAIRPA